MLMLMNTDEIDDNYELAKKELVDTSLDKLENGVDSDKVDTWLRKELDKARNRYERESVTNLRNTKKKHLNKQNLLIALLDKLAKLFR